MNPSVKKEEHVLGIDEGLHEPSLEHLLDTALYYDLEPTEANQIVSDVLAVVATWRTRAKKAHISSLDIQEMEQAFSNLENIKRPS